MSSRKNETGDLRRIQELWPQLSEKEKELLFAYLVALVASEQGALSDGEAESLEGVCKRRKAGKRDRIERWLLEHRFLTAKGKQAARTKKLAAQVLVAAESVCPFGDAGNCGRVGMVVGAKHAAGE